MKIDEYFNELLRKLDPDDADLDKGRQRAERVARILRNDPGLGVLETRVGGSCGKGTAIRPIRDVDLFVYLEEEAWRTSGGAVYKPHTVLRRFHERLSRTFRKPIADRDVALRLQEHSIGVRYVRDGAVAIDVVPALWANRNKAEIVQIPERSSREWRSTCITRQALLLRKYDHDNRYLCRGIRLLKAWRQANRLDLRSYALELLALRVAKRQIARHPRAIFMGVMAEIGESELLHPMLMTDYVAAEQFGPTQQEDVVTQCRATTWPPDWGRERDDASSRPPATRSVAWKPRSSTSAVVIGGTEGVRSWPRSGGRPA